MNRLPPTGACQTSCQDMVPCFQAPRAHNAVIRVYDKSGNVIETHERAGDFKEW
jgi:hypothetical protein